MKIEILIVILFIVAIQTCEAGANESCPKTQIENRTDEWNDYDQQTYERALKRCGEIYKDSPCLKKFIKKDQMTYNAICGR